MKKLIYISFCLYLNLFCMGQDCPEFSVNDTIIQGNLMQSVLKVDNDFNGLWIKSRIDDNGDLGSRKYAPIIKSNNIWMGGLDFSGNIYLASGKNEITDWKPGSLDILGDPVPNCDFWNQIFSFTRDDIFLAIQVFNDELPCSDMPASVLNWPARNNPNIAELIPDKQYASFYDNNFDGNYNPCDGDLPFVQDNYNVIYSRADVLQSTPNKVTFYVMNDNSGPHLSSLALPLEMEVYVYTIAVTNKAADDFIFYKYIFNSKSDQVLRNFHLGQRIDFELGCGEDDYIGSIPDLHMVYAYNSNSDIECGENSFQNPLMAGVSYIDGLNDHYIYEGDSLIPFSFSSGANFDLYTSLGIKSVVIPFDCGSSLSTTCNPIGGEESYNVLRGKNKDGSDMINNNGQTVSYTFDGNPAVIDEWSLCSDPKIIESTAYLNSSSMILDPSEVQYVTFAAFVTEEVDSDCPDTKALSYMRKQAKYLNDVSFSDAKGPPPPTLNATNHGHIVTLNLSNIPFSYLEWDLSDYHVLDAQPYTFEGVKIFQVASENFDLTELDNPLMSHLIYQGDIMNDVETISNWQPRFDLEDVSYTEEVAVFGANLGILEALSIDYDYINAKQIDPNDELYFVAVAYAYNPNEFDPNNPEVGKQYPYIQSTYGVKVIKSVIDPLTTSDIKLPKYNLNVSSNIFTVSEIETDIEIRLISLAGQILQTWKISALDYFQSEDLSYAYPNGMYLLSVSSDLGDEMSHKVVIVK